jgi:uncharacterized delta-60 repeat protein
MSTYYCESCLTGENKYIDGGDLPVVISGNPTIIYATDFRCYEPLEVVSNLDPLFSIGAGFNNDVNTIQIQSDGKILVGGDFTSYSGVFRNRIIRLNADYTVDISFVIGTGFDNSVNTIALQSDGKILVGGSFTLYSGVSNNSIVRLNTDGSVDNSFVIGTGFSQIVYDINLQSDGKILVCGGFSSYSGVSSNGIIRLNSNGSIDTSFVVGSGFFGFFGPQVYSLILQSDGKILVGGDFISYSGASSENIIRLNTDGSVDTSFVIGTGFNSLVTSFEIQGNGKILVGGSFTSYDGVSSNNIIRLNTDGSIDSSFVVGTGFNGFVTSFEIQGNGKILVGGFFTSYSGVSSNRIIRLNTDGSIDSSFVVGTGFDNIVRTIQLQSGGKVLVGGLFTTLNSESYPRFAVLLEEPQSEYTAIELFTDCEICNGYVIPISANTEYIDCLICDGNALLVDAPHPVWTGLNGGAVTQLDAVTIGGNGWNS